jgi:hypothetical protein
MWLRAGQSGALQAALAGHVLRSAERSNATAAKTSIVWASYRPIRSEHLFESLRFARFANCTPSLQFRRRGYIRYKDLWPRQTCSSQRLEGKSSLGRF